MSFPGIGCSGGNRRRTRSVRHRLAAGQLGCPGGSRTHCLPVNSRLLTIELLSIESWYRGWESNPCIGLMRPALKPPQLLLGTLAEPVGIAPTPPAFQTGARTTYARAPWRPRRDSHPQHRVCSPATPLGSRSMVTRRGFAPRSRGSEPRVLLIERPGNKTNFRIVKELERMARVKLAPWVW